MSILQNVDVNIKELVDDIEKGNYLIPKFQRDFVWKIPDIESLGDSIIRGYPISSMLMMPTNGNLKVASSPLKTHGTHVSEGSGLYVLDGQQRLTSIAKLFAGLDDSKEYYFDMLSILSDKFPEDNIHLIPSIAERLAKGRHDRQNGFSEITQELCRAFNKKTNDTSDTRQAHRFIRGKEIISQTYSSTVNKFLRVFGGISDEVEEKYNNYLNGIFGSMSGYGVPVTKINAAADLGLVVRVFEKVNSSGKKLTLFDLINAKSFGETHYSDLGLADYITQKLNELNVSQYNIRAIDIFFEGRTVSDVKSYGNLARFVRSFSASSFIAKGVVPGITNSDMLAKDPNFWFDGWNSTSASLLQFINWLSSEDLIDQANTTFVEYIASIIMTRPKLLNEPLFMREVKRYILYINIAGTGFSKTNLDVIMTFVEFGNFLMTAHEFNKHTHHFFDSIYTYPMTADNFLNRGEGKHRFDSIFYIIYSEKAGGKFNIDLLGNSIKSSCLSGFDRHHIFPKAQTKAECHPLYTSVSNFVLLNSSSNRHEVKDKHPVDYLRKIRSIYPDAYENIISQNMLEDFDSAVTHDQAIAALDKRLQKIATLVQTYFN